MLSLYNGNKSKEAKITWNPVSASYLITAALFIVATIYFRIATLFLVAYSSLLSPNESQVQQFGKVSVTYSISQEYNGHVSILEDNQR